MTILSIALTLVATFDLFRDEACHVWPPIIAADQFDGPILAQMSCCKSVVACFYDILPEFWDIGDVESTLIVDKTIFFFPSSYAISESLWSSLINAFKTFQYFCFSVTGLAYPISKGIACRFIVCGSHCLEVLQC